MTDTPTPKEGLIKAQQIYLITVLCRHLYIEDSNIQSALCMSVFRFNESKQPCRNRSGHQGFDARLNRPSREHIKVCLSESSWPLCTFPSSGHEAKTSPDMGVL
jgi:hypothetical protein